MTFSYNNPYSNFPLSPSVYSFEYIDLDGDFTFAWPENNTDSQYIISQQMYVTTTDIANQLILPPANLVGVGRTFQIFNYGSTTFTVYDNTGTSLATITTGQLYQFTVGDNSDEAGVWETPLLGVGTSGADANALAGYGLSALSNSKLNTNLPEKIVNTAYTVLASDRGSVLSYTGGTNPMTFPTPVSGFNLGVINNSSTGGLLTLTCPGFTFNGQSTLLMSPGDSTFITGGANYNAIGIGRQLFNTSSLLTLNVSASTDVTLTAAQCTNDIIVFTGALANAITVSFNPSQVNKYDLYNNTTGGFDITVEVDGGSNNYDLKMGETNSFFTDTSELYVCPNLSGEEDAPYWLSSSYPALANSVNLGALSPGVLGISVTGSVATPYKVTEIYENTGLSNLFIGTDAGNNTNTTGIANVFTGPGSGTDVTSGQYNVGYGVNTLSSITTTSNSTAVGYSALGLSTGSGNTAIGAFSQQAGTTVNNNTSIGVNTLNVNTASNGTAIGAGALAANTTGSANLGAGFNALTLNTTGQYNCAVGTSAMNLNVSGSNNTSVGTNSLVNNISGSGNTAMGFAALNLNTNSNNTAFGNLALSSCTNFTANSAFGSGSLANFNSGGSSAFGYLSQNANTSAINDSFGAFALQNNISGGLNSAFGNSALSNGTNPTNCSAFGNLALTDTSAANNNGFGYFSLGSNTSGTGNVAFGNESLGLLISGNNNVGLGNQTLSKITTQSNNTAVGINAGAAYSSYNNGLFLGCNADTNQAGLSNICALGYNAVIGVNNGLATSYQFHGFGRNSPIYCIHLGIANSVLPYLGMDVTSDPPAPISNTGIFYTKTVGGVAHPFFANSSGTNDLLTSGNVIGPGSSIVGHIAVFNNTGGTLLADSGIAIPVDSNTIYGYQAYATGAAAQGNTAFGYQALNAILASGGGQDNTAIGEGAGLNITSGSGNTFLGSGSGGACTTGAGNIGIGGDSLFSAITASGNVAIGQTAMNNAINGLNTAIGNAAGNASGANSDYAFCTFIGCSATSGGAGMSNSVAIGYQAQVVSSNTIILGNTNVTTVGMGIAANKFVTANSQTVGAQTVGTSSAMVAGTTTITTTAVQATSKIFLTGNNNGVFANLGSLRVGTITAGTSFTIVSSNILDTSTVNWFIINPV